MNSKNPLIVLLGGEGIGPEVVEATADVLTHLLPEARFERPVHGEAAIGAQGSPLPESTREVCRQADAILFGATANHSREVLGFLRWGLETYANLRPAKSLPGIPSPLKKDAPIDLLIVRENLEGEYPAREGKIADLHANWPGFRESLGFAMPDEGLFTLRVTTEQGSRKIAETAARLAAQRRGKVTIVTKSNVLRRTDGMFFEIAEGVMKKAGLDYNHYYVDDAARRLVAEPEKFDVMVSPNLFGDILSDIAAELVGGMGLAPSGCVGDRHSYFESVHGSAPDIAGKGIANPLATVLSAQMLLDHLGCRSEAEALEGAVVRLLTERRVLTPDLGGSAGTRDVTGELIRLLA